MRLNAPKMNIWVICLILAIVGVVLWGLPWINVVLFDYQSVVGFLCMTVAYVLLMLATVLKGM